MRFLQQRRHHRPPKTTSMLSCKSIHLRCNIPQGLPQPDHFDIVNRHAQIPPPPSPVPHYAPCPSAKSLHPCQTSSAPVAACSRRQRCTQRHIASQRARDGRHLQVISADPYLRGIMKTHPAGSVISGARSCTRCSTLHCDARIRLHSRRRAAGDPTPLASPPLHLTLCCSHPTTLGARATSSDAPLHSPPFRCRGAQ